MKVKSQNISENKMGIMPVNKLLISMSLPIVLSMIIQSLYNIVDSIYVAMISEEALTAVTISFPIQQLMVSVAVGTFVGVNALLSKSLGEKNTQDVKDVACNGLFLSILSYIIFLVFGLLFARLYISFQADSKQIYEYGVDYISVVSIFSFGWFAQNSFEKLLMSTGKTFYSMITQTVGAIINIILDPIFIFGWLGLPAMGVKGAAIATVIGQIFAGILAYIFNKIKNKEVTISIKGFRPKWEIIKRIYMIGIPSIIMLSISSITIFGMNKILMAFSSTATAVYGIYFKLQSFVFMPVFGINNGMVPIIAYNYGTRNKDRIIKTIKLSELYAISIMIIGLIIMQLFSKQILLMFNASENMLDIGIPALKIISICFIFAGFCVVTASVFQALGYAFFSMIISIARQLVILLPVAFLLSKAGNVNNVWWAFPIAEIGAVILTALFLKHTYKKIISKI